MESLKANILWAELREYAEGSLACIGTSSGSIISLALSARWLHSISYASACSGHVSTVDDWYSFHRHFKSPLSHLPQLQTRNG